MVRSANESKREPLASPRLLIVEDDVVLARVLQRSFERRGYSVGLVPGAAELERHLPLAEFGYAVVDLNTKAGSGLPCVRQLRAHDPAMIIVAIAGALRDAAEALRLGVREHLTMPVSTDDIEGAMIRAK